MPPSQYAKQKEGLSSVIFEKQGYWQETTIRRILKNRIYTGDMVQGKTKIVNHKEVLVDEKDWIVVEHTHEPIVSKEQFQQIQNHLLQAAEQYKKVKKNPYNINKLKGKIFCQCCGRPLYRRREGDSEQYYYCCVSMRFIKKEHCQGIYITEKEVFEKILCMFHSRKSFLLENKEILIQKVELLQEQKKQQEQQIEKYKKEMEQKTVYLQRLYENFINEIISQQEYQDWKGEYQQEISMLLQEIEDREKECNYIEENIVAIIKLQ